jgi:hypothetical protein
MPLNPRILEQTAINRSHIYIAPDCDSCPWSGCQPSGDTSPARIVAVNPSSPVIRVSGPVAVSLVHLSLSGGSPGLAMEGNAFVTTYGVVAEGNEGAGIDVGGASSLAMNEGGTRNNVGAGLVINGGGNANLFGAADWLRNTPLVISGNGIAGIRMDRGQLRVISGVVIEANQGWGLFSYGGDTTFGGCCGTETVVQDNAGGAFLTEGSEASFWGRTTLRENGPFGVWVEAGSHATFYQSGGGQNPIRCGRRAPRGRRQRHERQPSIVSRSQQDSEQWRCKHALERWSAGGRALRRILRPGPRDRTYGDQRQRAGGDLA